jgi:hypothetical protein
MMRHVYAICPIIKISLIVEVPPGHAASGDNEEGKFFTLQWRGKHTLLLQYREGFGKA